MTDRIAYDDPFSIPERGRLETWTQAEYLAYDAPSRTDLFQIATEGPYAWKWHKDHGSKEETDAMRLGTAVHAALLEPELFETRVKVFADRRSGATWESFKVQHAGCVILTANQYERAVRIRDYVLEEPKLSRLFSVGLREQAMVWRDELTGLEVKAKPDFLDLERGRAVDIKTTSDLDEWALMRSAKGYGYPMQGAMFLDGAALCLDDVQITDVWLLYISSDGPPLVKLRRLPEEAIAFGRRQFRSAMDLYAECIRTGEWPRPRIVPEDMAWVEESR